jgi:hypothetical protein
MSDLFRKQEIPTSFFHHVSFIAVTYPIWKMKNCWLQTLRVMNPEPICVKGRIRHRFYIRPKIVFLTLDTVVEVVEVMKKKIKISRHFKLQIYVLVWKGNFLGPT